MKQRSWLLISAIILVALLSVAGVRAISPTVSPKNFGIVDEGRLYRSGQLTPAATEQVVSQHHIRTIIDLGAYDKDPTQEKIAARTALALNVHRHVFRLEGDGTGNPNAYVEALRIIADPKNQPVLVHCSAGAQRTSACVILYHQLIQHQPKNDPQLQEAIHHGHNPTDNPRLGPYLAEWTEPISKAFESGVLIKGFDRAEIPSVPE